jgi:hypothetical protein
MNRQSAAKELSINDIYAQSSTTIPRKGSTIEILEKVHMKFYNLDDFNNLNSGIYCILSVTNFKIYVGSALNMKARIIRHKSYLKRNCHHSLKMQRSYNKYKNFYVGVLEETIYLKDKEEFWIKKLNTVNEGFNNTYKCYEYKKFKLKKNQVIKSTNTKKIKVISFDFEGNIYKKFNSVSEAALFFKTSSSNISRCCKGELNYMKDHTFIYAKNFIKNKNYAYLPAKKIFTEEHKNNLSKSLKGKKNSEYQILLLIKRCSKRIKKINIKTKEEIIYDSMKNCCKQNKLYIETLKKYIENKTLLGEFLYEFYEDIV